MFLNKKFKIFEFAFLFILIPIFFYIKIIPFNYLLPLLWIVSLYVLFILKKYYDVAFFEKINIKELKFILYRFFLISLAIIIFTYIFFEEYLFSFLLEKTKLYILVMIFYPILSVIPQELIFRKFFFERYNFNLSINSLIFINACCFSFAHIIFNNYLALIFTFIGSYLFSRTYKKTNSFVLVCIEHTLYGNLLFTVGLGYFFYNKGTILFLNIM